MGVSIVMGVPPNGWFVRENRIKMDDFGGTPISGNTHMCGYSWPIVWVCPQKWKIVGSRVNLKKMCVTPLSSLFRFQITPARLNSRVPSLALRGNIHSMWQRMNFWLNPLYPGSCASVFVLLFLTLLFSILLLFTFPYSILFSTILDAFPSTPLFPSLFCFCPASAV